MKRRRTSDHPGRKTNRSLSEHVALQTEVSRLLRVLGASRGCFSLAIADCNCSRLRDRLIEELRRRHAGIKVVSVPAGTTDVYGAVRQGARDAGRQALFLVDIERSVSSADSHHPALRSLNAARELWESFACPIVLWLPDYAVTLLSVHARDLWRFVSHQFRFRPAAAILTYAPSFATDALFPSLLAPEKERARRVAELRARIASAGPEPSGNMVSHLGDWLAEWAMLEHADGNWERADEALHRLRQLPRRTGERVNSEPSMSVGEILLSRGDLERADVAFQEAAQYAKDVGIAFLEAAALHQRGIVAHRRQDLDTAERLYQESLRIRKELRDEQGLGRSYHQLGMLEHDRGRLEEAEEWYEEALRIKQRRADATELASTYHQLGMLAQDRGDLARAAGSYEKALALNQPIGNRRALAATHHQLGLVARARGDLEQAERCFHDSLAMKQRVGDDEGLAASWYELGRTALDRGDAARAKSWLSNALEIDERLGHADAVVETRRLLSSLGETPQRAGVSARTQRRGDGHYRRSHR